MRRISIGGGSRSIRLSVTALTLVLAFALAFYGVPFVGFAGPANEEDALSASVQDHADDQSTGHAATTNTSASKQSTDATVDVTAGPTGATAHDAAVGAPANTDGAAANGSAEADAAGTADQTAEAPDTTASEPASASSTAAEVTSAEVKAVSASSDDQAPAASEASAAATSESALGEGADEEGEGPSEQVEASAESAAITLETAFNTQSRAASALGSSAAADSTKLKNTSTTEKTYTITWKDEDGTVLAETQVAAGKTPEYPNAEPTKAEDDTYTYAFKGWNPKVAAATNDRNYRAEYEATAKPAQADETLGEKARFYVTNIVKANAINSTSAVQTMVKNSTKTLTARGVLNLAGGSSYNTSYYGVTYTFLNVYVFSTGKVNIWESATDGVTVNKLKNNNDGTVTATMSDGTTQLINSNVVAISPVYSAKPNWYLNYNYIDNISTGSGAWRNEDAVSSYTHTFRNPESQPHYQFVYWQEEGTDTTYTQGDTFTYSSVTPKENQVVVNTYAVWQPSVTVNYYSWDGKLLKTVEQFTDITTANAYEAPQVDGADFLGWYTGPEASADKAAATYKAPATTTDPVERTVYDVYAHYSTTYKVEHAQQNIEDDDYTVAEPETQTFTSVLLGSNAEATAKTFEGFTFNEAVDGTLVKAVIDKAGIVLKLFYDRNKHDVTYSYTGAVPADATALPDDATYKYGASVSVASEPTATGHTFSGWSKSDFAMPDEDVVITGSFTPNSYTVTYRYEGTVPAGASALPSAAKYKYGETVSVAADATASGYTFSGWSSAGSFIMPAGDVVITGSFTQVPAEGEDDSEPEDDSDPEPADEPDAEDDPTPTPAPTPTPTPAPTPTPVVPVVPADTVTPTAPDATPAPAPAPAAQDTISDDDNPLDAGEAIEDDANALASGESAGAWSLFDLVATIAAALLCIVMLVGAIGRKRDRTDGEDGQGAASDRAARVAGQGVARASQPTVRAYGAASQPEDDPDQVVKRRRALRAASLLPAVGSIVLFVLTQDLTQPMVIFDMWSLAFAIIAAINIILTIASRKKKEDEDDDADVEHDSRRPAPATV